MSRLLSKKLFLKSFEYAPRIAICILFKNPRGEILLTKRGVLPFQGSWHYPGGFLLKGEKIKDCLKRVAKKEIGINLDADKMKLLGIFENLKGDPRGHVIDVIYENQIQEFINLAPNKETEESMFFKKLPQKIAFKHQITLKKLGYSGFEKTPSISKASPKITLVSSGMNPSASPLRDEASKAGRTRYVTLKEHKKPRPSIDKLRMVSVIEP